MADKTLTLKGLEKDVKLEIEHLADIADMAISAAIHSFKTQRDQHANILATAYEEDYAALTEDWEDARKKA